MKERRVVEDMGRTFSVTRQPAKNSLVWIHTEV